MIEHINRIITEQKISQVRISELTGLSKTYISNFLSGRIKNPTIETVQKIADAVGVSMSELFKSEHFTAMVNYNGEMKQFNKVDDLKKFVEGI